MNKQEITVNANQSLGDILKQHYGGDFETGIEDLLENNLWMKKAQWPIKFYDNQKLTITRNIGNLVIKNQLLAERAYIASVTEDSHKKDGIGYDTIGEDLIVY